MFGSDSVRSLPQLGNVHKDGQRWIGEDDQRRAEDLYRAGTPPMHRLDQRSVTAAVARVRVGDVLAVSFDGRWWWASAGAEVIGRLTWALSAEEQRPWLDYRIVFPRSGTVRITRLLVSPSYDVVNCGGVVVPL